MAGVNSKVQGLGAFVWSIAVILRRDFKQSEYSGMILPFVVMRHLDCLLETSKRAFLNAKKLLPQSVNDTTRVMILFDAVGGCVKVYNLSQLGFESPIDFQQEPAKCHG